MKISSKQKKEYREKILLAAVKIITEKGFKSSTMKDITAEAGVADATIYKYFPTKESLLYGYYEYSFEKVIEELKNIGAFNEFSLHEQFQTFFETSLNFYKNDREFVLETFQMTFMSVTTNFHDLSPIRKNCVSIIRDLLEAAIEVEEIPEPAGKEMIEYLLFDYYFGMVLYWIKDTSADFTNTTLLIDKTMGIIITLLKSDISNKLFDLFSYLFKTHVLSNFDIIKESADVFSKVKRNFMGEH